MSGLPSASLPRLLAGVVDEHPISLEGHLAVHGVPPIGRDAPDAAALVETLERSGLRGRGGAAFPTAVKVHSVARARTPVVVVNGAEGEPASSKDRLLIERTPHLVLDGAQITAGAVGSREVIVCLPDDAPRSVASLERAVQERSDWRLAAVSLSLITDAYVAGEESAVVAHLNGGAPIPTFKPPYPFQRGVGRAPTLVNNVETLAHVGLIARHGPDWFRELGTPEHPGSALITLSGGVAAPGVYEIAMGAPLADLIAAAGGASDDVRAVLLGGYAGSWVDGVHHARLALDDGALVDYGAGIGAGIVVVLPAHACGPAETAHIANYLARESAGQCGPCAFGLPAIASLLDQLVAGRAESNARALLARWSADVNGRGACRHPDGAVRFISSALSVFADEFADHAQYGPCEACSRPRVLAVGAPHRRPRSAAAMAASSR